MFGHYHANTLAAGLGWADLIDGCSWKNDPDFVAPTRRYFFVRGTIDSNNGEEKVAMGVYQDSAILARFLAEVHGHRPL